MKSRGVLHLYAAVVRQSVEQPYSSGNDYCIVI